MHSKFTTNSETPCIICFDKEKKTTISEYIDDIVFANWLQMAILYYTTHANCLHGIIFFNFVAGSIFCGFVVVLKA
jgi:hypothetical protein